MSEYSDTDLRVIRYLRGWRRTTSAVGKECFRLPGGEMNSGLRPAAAHLSRMAERGLVKRAGTGNRTIWFLAEKLLETEEDLFSEVPSEKGQVPKEKN